MSVVRGLVLLHLSATAVLSVVLMTVMASQRAADVVRRRRGLRPVPVAAPQEAGASVLDWTIDLRTPAAPERGAVLQQTS